MVILNATPKYLAYYYQQWLWWCGDGGGVDVGVGGGGCVGGGGNDKKQWWQQHASRGIYRMKVFFAHLPWTEFSADICQIMQQ